MTSSFSFGMVTVPLGSLHRCLLPFCNWRSTFQFQSSRQRNAEHTACTISIHIGLILLCSSPSSRGGSLVVLA